MIPYWYETSFLIIAKKQRRYSVENRKKSLDYKKSSEDTSSQ